jgi:hypothetical protein
LVFWLVYQTAQMRQLPWRPILHHLRRLHPLLLRSFSEAIYLEGQFLDIWAQHIAHQARNVFVLQQAEQSWVRLEGELEYPSKIEQRDQAGSRVERRMQVLLVPVLLVVMYQCFAPSLTKQLREMAQTIVTTSKLVLS